VLKDERTLHYFHTELGFKGQGLRHPDIMSEGSRSQQVSSLPIPSFAPDIQPLPSPPNFRYLTVISLTSEEIGLLYTFAQLSNVVQHRESVRELVDEIDLLDIPSLVQLEDESFELVVRTSSLPELRKKFCTRFPDCDITIYDPTEPTETDSIHYSYDQAKARTVNEFLKRKAEMMSGSHISVEYYNLRAKALRGTSPLNYWED
jgi:hypothetical protein